MNTSAKQLGGTVQYEPPKVSRWFKYDWQFAVDMSKLPLLRPASLMIGFMPLLIDAAESLFGVEIISIPLSAWLMWWASVAFIASWVILKFKCPTLIQDYRNYGEYQTHDHSPRWIAWLFYNTITKFSSWKTIVQETLAKEISVDVASTASPDAYSVCPWLVRMEQGAAETVFEKPLNASAVHVFYPVNIGRNIYIPIHCDGTRLLLPLQEDDRKLKEKEKELFWILYSQAAKEKPRWRGAFWVLLYGSFLLLALNVLKNIVLVGWWLSLGSGTADGPGHRSDMQSSLLGVARVETDRLHIAASGTHGGNFPDGATLSVTLNGTQYSVTIIDKNSGKKPSKSDGEMETVPRDTASVRENPERAPQDEHGEKSQDGGPPPVISIEFEINRRSTGGKN